MPEPIELTGTDTVVNTFTSGTQSEAAVTVLADGSFVVTWTSFGQDGSANGVYGQRYDATGATVGTNFQINTFTSGTQRSSTVTALENGGFVVTWWSDNQDGSGPGIYAQRYDAAGATAGSEFQVNTFTTGLQQFPSTTALSDGGFLVTWHSAQDGGLNGIYAQRYNADGSPSGAEFRVNTTTSNDQSLSSVTGLSDGGFVVTWQSRNQVSGSSADDIFGQRYDANGAPVGGEFQVNTFVTSEQRLPAVAALANGGFVVTWASLGQDGDSNGVYGQAYGANGQPSGAEFRANTFTTNSQTVPAVIGLADGGFIVAWESFGQSGGFSVYAQRYDAAGAPLGAETLMSTGPGSQLGAAIAILNDGRLITVWGEEITFRLADLEGNDGPVVVWPTRDGIVSGTEGKDVMRLGFADTDGDAIDAGDNNILGLGGKDKIFANDGNDTIDGGSGNDQVNGEDGNDVLMGGTGRDNLFGGRGDDSLDGNDDNDTLNGEDGKDSLNGGAGDDALSGGAGNDNMTGEAGNDLLSGGSGNDVLLGSAGNDTLRGDAGRDTLSGLDNDDGTPQGTGDYDVLTGGSGADTFVFDYGSGTNVVTDFEQGTDRFWLASQLPEGTNRQSFLENSGYVREEGTEFIFELVLLTGEVSTVALILRSSSPIELSTLGQSFITGEF